eukprot:TRINITY_DN13898_c0_g1_i1.p1 TRINITY_DN13898_c0_g1~~TRINITY_DN13898_c0_g1_i1.p1  ORF type:complete len:121 (-),score=28.18 TRINITY_DN13898_c0_g1_i1:39-401(-)
MELLVKDKEAFFELSEKHNTIAQELGLIQQRLSANEFNRSKAKATLRELEKEPDTTKTYQSVGRMFLQTPIGSVRDDLTQQVAQYDESIKNLTLKGQYFEKELKEVEDNIKELTVFPEKP